MKRQRGRNRGGGGGGGGGGKPQQNANRAFDSNGPDNIKVRGHAQHVFEKYQQLARDATSSGDRVLAENFLQHAEHYFRVLRTLQPNRPIAEFVARDTFSGYDIDFEDESGAQALPDETPMDSQGDGQGDSGEYAARDQRDGRWENRQNNNGQNSNGQSNNGQSSNGQNNNGQAGNGQRDSQRDDRGSREVRDRDRNRFDRDRPREDRGYAAEGQSSDARDDRSRDDRSRDDRSRDDRSDRSRDDRNRDDRQGGDRQANDRPSGDRQTSDRQAPDRQSSDRQSGDRQSGDRQTSDRQTSDRPSGGRDGGYQARDRAPREDRFGEDRPPRRERSYEPRGERADPLPVVEPQAQPLTAEVSAPSVDEGAGVLRSRDGETSHAPAFLQAAAAPAPATDEVPVKRPRGRPRKVKDPAAEEA